MTPRPGANLEQPPARKLTAQMYGKCRTGNHEAGDRGKLFVRDRRLRTAPERAGRAARPKPPHIASWKRTNQSRPSARKAGGRVFPSRALRRWWRKPPHDAVWTGSLEPVLQVGIRQLSSGLGVGSPESIAIPFSWALEQADQAHHEHRRGSLNHPADRASTI